MKVFASLRDALSLYGGGVVSIVGAGGKTTLLFRLAKELMMAGERVVVTTTTKIFMPKPHQTTEVIIAPDMKEWIRRAAGRSPCPEIVTAAAEHDTETGKLIGFSPEAIEVLWERGGFRWILVEADGASQLPLKAPADHEPVIPECSRAVVAVIGLDALGKPLTDQWVFRTSVYAQLTGLSEGDLITPESVAVALSAEGGIMKGCPWEAKHFVFLNKAETEADRNTGRTIGNLVWADDRAKSWTFLIGCLGTVGSEIEQCQFG